jgi:hypothetical protein
VIQDRATCSDITELTSGNMWEKNSLPENPTY